MNKIPCSNCIHFDPQYKFVNGVKMPVWYGFCSVKSIYPNTDQDNQKAPEGVKRAAFGELAKMKVLGNNAIESACLSMVERNK